MKSEEYNVKPKQAEALNDLNKIIGKKIPCLDERGIPSFGVKIDNMAWTLWSKRTSKTNFKARHYQRIVLKL